MDKKAADKAKLAADGEEETKKDTVAQSKQETHETKKPKVAKGAAKK